MRVLLALCLVLVSGLAVSAVDSKASVRGRVERRHGDRSFLTRSFIRAQGPATEKYCGDKDKGENCHVIDLDPIVQAGGHTCWSGTTAMILNYYHKREKKCPFKIYGLVNGRDGKPAKFLSVAQAVDAGLTLAKEENHDAASEGNVGEGDSDKEVSTKPELDPKCPISSPTVIAAMGPKIDTSTGAQGRSTENVIESFGFKESNFAMPSDKVKWSDIKNAIRDHKPIALCVQFRTMHHAVVIMGYREMPAAEKGGKSTHRKVLIADPYPKDSGDAPRAPKWRDWNVNLNARDESERKVMVLGRKWTVDKLVFTKLGTSV